MAKKKTARRSVARRAARNPQGAAEYVRDTWQQTLAALNAAESGIEKQVRGLLKRNKISTRDAKSALQGMRALVDRERKKAVKDLESRLRRAQARVRSERKALTRMVEDTVGNALASFNIPSRREVRDLSRRVEQLSRKIGSSRR